MKKPSRHLAKKLALKLLLSFFIVLFFGQSLLQADPVVRVVNGRIKKISADQKKVEIFYLRPATGKIEALFVLIDERTGFKKGAGLEDFGSGDPISIDYEETESGFRAIQIRLVPLQGVPEDIRRPF